MVTTTVRVLNYTIEKSKLVILPQDSVGTFSQISAGDALSKCEKGTPSDGHQPILMK